MRALRNTWPRHHRGFSLVELMVAIAVGMVLTLAVFGVLAMAEGRKRVTTGLNDLEQSGNLALYQLDQWVRSAGSGFAGTAVVDKSAYGCLLRARNKEGQTLPRSAALPAPFADVDPDGKGGFPLLPVMILPAATTPGASGKTSDALVIMAGSSSMGGAGLSMTADPTSDKLSFSNTLPFAASDLLLMVDPSVGSTCLVTQVSSKFSSESGSATDVSLGGDFYADEVEDTSVSSSFKHDSGVVLPLGSPSTNPPQFLVVGVGDNNTLYSYDLLQIAGEDSALQARADSVFEMHALYGVDTGGDGKIDSWVTGDDKSDYAVSKLVAGTTAAQTLIKRIKAIRVGLILRTTLPEKSAEDTSTPKSLTLFPDLDGVSFTRKLSDTEQQYRYRTMEATLVLRNNLVMKD
jgi:type IV pilus assembly protein PilW